MRIGIASSFGVSVGLWLRLVAEGASVRVYIDEKEQRKVGEGLIDRCGSWPELLAWAKDGALAGEPTLVLFDSSGLGDKADEARRWGLHVIGGGGFCDRLEKERTFGFKIAERAGAALPPYRDFSSFDAAREFSQSLGEEDSVYWKSDRFLESDATHKADGGRDLTEYLDSVIRRFGRHGSCMIQEKVEGVALSTARWWNGRAWVGPYEGTIEHKPAYNGDIGPATGCSFNAVWMYDDPEPLVAERLGWDGLAVAFMKAEAPAGLYDINAIAGDDGEMYFLEWTPRFGYDSEPTSMRLIDNLAHFYWAIASGGHLGTFSSELAYSIRLGVPPYPWEHAKKDMKHGAIGLEVRGEPAEGDLWSESFIGYELARNEFGLYVASPEGIVGLAYAQGAHLSDLHDEAEETAQAMRKTAGLSFRTDGGDMIAEDAEKILAAGFDVPPGLLL